MSELSPASLRFVIPFRRAAWRDANPDVINCMRPGPFGNPFVPVDPKNPEHARRAVELFGHILANGNDCLNSPIAALFWSDGYKTHFVVHWKYREPNAIEEHFDNMRARIRLLSYCHVGLDLAKQPYSIRFGCSCALDAPACHRDPIIEYYLKCRKEYETND